MIKIPSYSLLREQDQGKMPVLDVRNLGIDFGGLTAVDEFNITIGPKPIEFTAVVSEWIEGNTSNLPMD